MALLVLGAAVLALHGVYVVLAVGDVWWRLRHHAAAGVYPGAGSRWLSALAPFLGGNLLAGFAAVRPALPEPLLTAALWASRVIYPLTWLGMGLASWRAFVAARTAQTNTPRDTIATIALAGLTLQALLFGALRIPCQPQYFFGTFPFHIVPAWLALDALRRWPLGAAIGAIYGAGGALLTLGTMLAVNRDGYGAAGWPRLWESVEVVRALNRFDDAEVRTDVPFYAKHAEPLRALRLLLPPAPRETPRLSGRLFISRGMANATGTDEITLLELPATAPLPPVPRIDVTPLPPGWIPPPETW
jgi:hypothetical protein